MADTTFNTAAGVAIAREKLVAYLNTGSSSSPVWSAIGARVDDSSAEYDWSKDSKKDILGTTYSTMKKPIITQSFDPLPLENSAAIVKLWNMAVKDQDAQTLAAQDMLIVHLYAGTADTAMFAERYDGCSIEVTGLGGEGGGNIDMPITVTYGGNRTVGTAAISAAGVVTFT